MMLFKLSIKNIKKSFKDYAIYFLTLILGVAIFYVFNSIESQTAMMSFSQSTEAMIELMTNLLSSVSVFVSFILGFLIIYASRFLIKRRNKEFGVYLTLGMSKRKISTILFFETLLIGIISLIVGLAIGFAASQFMSIAVANMFDADMTSFQFVFSESACVKSIAYFGIMYVIVMIFNTFSINKCQLIDLLHANKKTEQVKVKNPWICIVVFVASCITLGYAYNMVSSVGNLQNAESIFEPIVLGAVSTFFIFWSLSGLMLKIVMSMKNTYYKKLNSFTLRQVSSKINTTVFSMTIICLMLFITLGVLTTGLSMKDSLNENLRKAAPIDFQISKPVSYEAADIEDFYSKMDIDTDKYWDHPLSFYTYEVDNITLKETLGDNFETVKEQYKYLAYDLKEDIMSVSDYNKVAKIFGAETFSLKEDEYVMVANLPSFVEIRDSSLEKATTLDINGVLLKPKYSECKDGNIELATQKLNMGIIVVPDYLLKESQKTKEYLMGNYKAATKEEKEAVEDVIFSQSVIEKMNQVICYKTKLEISESSIGLGAIVTFIALYLGLIFLISSSAIIALKELSESSDNKERFMILRKIGADEKLLNRALFNQIGIFFLFPLSLAIIHSIFGMKFIAIFLSEMGIELVSQSTIATYVFLLVIYGVYFVVTYLCSKNIIRETK